VSSLETKMSSERRAIHVLTLTPFYPTRTAEASGCFVAEPLACLAAEFGVVSTVMAAQPVYRGMASANPAAPSEWVRYLAVPGGWGLPSAGAFLFARVVGRAREMHRSRKIDVIHAHAPLPCGHAAKIGRAHV
jgi:hypothetical protein